ncbi:unnamed protein product [Paramecium octaurelia]|uniref:Uncharacterized protein n=1 Tax=Paramecium octaurelia TaxID=43137 RepID=A0A8S1Y814_PAROT|nr:unnamed protein product [Paramecium octaurelia]
MTQGEIQVELESKWIHRIYFQKNVIQLKASNLKIMNRKYLKEDYECKDSQRIDKRTERNKSLKWYYKGFLCIVYAGSVRDEWFNNGFAQFLDLDDDDCDDINKYLNKRMYLRSVTRQEMQGQIDSLKLQIEQARQNHERAIKQMRSDHQKEIAVLQDEIRRTQEIVSNVQFQQYFKMKSDNSKLLQENALLRDMLRACQITNSTKEMEVSRLRQKLRRIEGQSLEVRKEPSNQSRQNEYSVLRKHSNYRHPTQPSLNESNTESSPKLLPIKFKVNQ